MAGESVAASFADVSKLDRLAEAVAPRGIEKAAKTYGLGSLQQVRLLTHPAFPAVVHLAGALLSAGAYLLLRRLAAGWEGEMSWRLELAIGLVKLGLAVFGGFLAGIGVFTLTRGRRAFYLWSGGFIYHHDGRTRVYPWADIEELLVVRHHTGDEVGEIYRYRLVPREGRPITIPIRLTDGQDPFNEALVAAMHEAGRPVA